MKRKVGPKQCLDALLGYCEAVSNGQEQDAYVYVQ